MRTNITDEDEGKQVMYDDETVGRVVEVRSGTAYVDPDPGMTDTIKSKLGWGESDEESFALDESSIAEITDDQVRLEVDM